MFFVISIRGLPIGAEIVITGDKINRVFNKNLLTKCWTFSALQNVILNNFIKKGVLLGQLFIKYLDEKKILFDSF